MSNSINSFQRFGFSFPINILFTAISNWPFSRDEFSEIKRTAKFTSSVFSFEKILENHGWELNELNLLSLASMDLLYHKDRKRVNNGTA